MPSSDVYDFLLIEERQTDIRSLVETLRTARVHHDLNIVQNTDAAFAYLKQQGPFSGVRRPDLIFLGLNSSNSKSMRLLKKIKSDPEICHIPVVVLTPSGDSTPSIAPLGMA